MSDVGPRSSPSGPARRVWAALRGSAIVAWVLYAMIGMGGASALVLMACDGEAHPDRTPPPPPRAKKPAGRPVAPPTPSLPRYELYPDLGAALLAVTRDHPRVIGVGELHSRTDRPAPTVSALARFSSEVLPALGDRVSDLVIETWAIDPTCRKGVTASHQIESSVKRPASTTSELGALFGVTRERAITAHVMRLSCDDLAALAGDAGVDAERLLTLVTRELDRITRSAVRYRDEHHESRPLILVYGGALHNNLYPFASTKAWSYALDVDVATGGHYVEVDVYAPELVLGDPLYEHEAWYPLIDQIDSRGVMLIERRPRSYLAILPRS